MRKVAVLLALSLGLVAGPAQAWVIPPRTYGAYTFKALAYKPIANGIFIGTVDVNCTNGAYKTACAVTNAAVKVTPQVRYWQNGTYSAPVNATVEQQKFCAKGSDGYCKTNATSLGVDTVCDCPVAQYRTRVKGGVVDKYGYWRWTGYVYSSWVSVTVCD